MYGKIVKKRLGELENEMFEISSFEKSVKKTQIMNMKLTEQIFKNNKQNLIKKMKIKLKNKKMKLKKKIHKTSITKLCNKLV